MSRRSIHSNWDDKKKLKAEIINEKPPGEFLGGFFLVARKGAKTQKGGFGKLNTNERGRFSVLGSHEIWTAPRSVAPPSGEGSDG
jgi:hypothetical protein